MYYLLLELLSHAIQKSLDVEKSEKRYSDHPKNEIIKKTGIKKRSRNKGLSD